MTPRLHNMIELTRPMIGIDLETTGADRKHDSIVEIAFEIMAPGKEPRDYRTLVNPLIPIPPKATAVHHITNDMVQGAPTFRQLAENLYSGLRDCDFCGYNILIFDLPLLVEEFKRAGFVWSYDDARIIDGYRLWQLAEGRTLSHAVKRWLDQEIDDVLADEGEAHNALWDVKMSTRVIAAQLRQCQQWPRDLDMLHSLCWPDRIDADGKLKKKDGAPCLTFGKYKNIPLEQVPKGYLQWMMTGDFSEKVKSIVSNTLTPSTGPTKDK